MASFGSLWCVHYACSMLCLLLTFTANSAPLLTLSGFVCVESFQQFILCAAFLMQQCCSHLSFAAASCCLRTYKVCWSHCCTCDRFYLVTLEGGSLAMMSIFCYFWFHTFVGVKWDWILEWNWVMCTETDSFTQAPPFAPTIACVIASNICLSLIHLSHIRSYVTLYFNFMLSDVRQHFIDA